MNDTDTEIRGVVTKVHFSKPTFSAGRLRPAGRRDEVAFAGSCYVKEGDVVKLRGAWTTHEKFGPQFQVEGLVLEDDLDADGLASWLSHNGLAVGIGPVKARKIAAEYGTSFGTILKEDPEQLAIFAGVSLGNIQRLAADWLAREEFNNLATKLAAWNLSRHEVELLAKRFGPSVLAVLQENPYLVLGEVAGLGFAKIDDIAQRLGFDKTHPGRIRAGVVHVLRQALNEGSTCENGRALVNAAEELLDLDTLDSTERIREQVAALTESGKDLRCVPDTRPDGGNWYALAWMLKYETAIASVLTCGRPNPVTPPAWVEANLPALCASLKDASQEQAIATALRHRIAVVSGGAGSGKTTCVRTLVRAYQSESFQDMRAEMLLGKLFESLADQPCGLSGAGYRDRDRDPRAAAHEETGSGFVYLLHDAAAGLHKIGMSVNPLARRKNLRCGSLSVEHAFFALDARAREREMHKFFADKRCEHPTRKAGNRQATSEWFRLDAGDVAYFKVMRDDAELDDDDVVASGFAASAASGFVKIALCAPTGKAARRLAEVTGVEACTIHRLLGWRPNGGGFYHGAEHPLPCDVVIADEVSMIPSDLAYHLLTALRPDAALVLVGDHHQLPPVGPGAMLRDCIKHELAPLTVLAKCHRQAGVLKHNCNRILDGVVERTAPKADGWSPWIVQDRLDSPDDVTTCIERLFKEILTGYGFKVPWDVQFMSPVHKGPIGTSALNVLLQRLHQETLGVKVSPTSPEQRPKLYVGDKVICTRNNYQLDIMNGHQGEVVETNPLAVEFDGRRVEIPKDCKGDIELAYCLTPHKMQGSEIPVAVTVCHRSHGFMLHRQWLYTAVTRARKCSIVIGDSRGVEQAAARVQVNNRKTLLGILARK